MELNAYSHYVERIFWSNSKIRKLSVSGLNKESAIELENILYTELRGLFKMKKIETSFEVEMLHNEKNSSDIYTLILERKSDRR